MAKFDTEPCRCCMYPFTSKCGEWEGNASLCACADIGMHGLTPS
jgi:hypothetical protein